MALPVGFEPTVSMLTASCLTTWRRKNGANDEIRTHFLKLTKFAHFQTCYKGIVPEPALRDYRSIWWRALGVEPRHEAYETPALPLG